jgi:7-cyano-7-deazaguanine synthase
MRLLLLSGGIDSAAIAWWQKPDLCLTIDYGQSPARGEIAASAALCSVLDLRHETISVDLRQLGSGLMAGRETLQLGSADEWWPYRNQVLITLAAMRYVGQGLREIMIGAVATDIHADGKLPFLEAIDRTLSVQEGNVRVTAPALSHTTLELLRLSDFPRDLLGVCFSCHAMEVACGQCGGCLKHVGTLEALGLGAVETGGLTAPEPED